MEQGAPVCVRTLNSYVPLEVSVVVEDNVGVPVIVISRGALDRVGCPKLKLDPLELLPSNANVVPLVNPVSTRKSPSTVAVATVLEIVVLKRVSTFEAV